MELLAGSFFRPSLHHVTFQIIMTLLFAPVLMHVVFLLAVLREQSFAACSLLCVSSCLMFVVSCPSL